VSQLVQILHDFTSNIAKAYGTMDKDIWIYVPNKVFNEFEFEIQKTLRFTTNRDLGVSADTIKMKVETGYIFIRPDEYLAGEK
jgi:FKBP-type peptidyl-prolyl cis-trans isomerase 2